MNKIDRAFKRSLLFIILSIVVLMFFNILITVVIFKDVVKKDQVLKIENIMTEISKAIYLDGNEYIIKYEGMYVLDRNGAWAMLLDKDRGNIKWSAYVPSEIPRKYTLTDVSKLSKYYLKDYPVFTWDYDGDLLVVGFPKDSYTKLSSNYHYIDTIKKIPIFLLSIIILDIFALLSLFFLMDYFTMKKINPILEGINKLKDGAPIDLEEHGTFKEINENLNKTSQVLEQKDIVRANWITSVSHDVRTPLTVIVGYIDSLKKDGDLTERSQTKLNIIETQCIKIKTLINDLNLYSKIEHDTKFLREERFYITPLLRKVIVEYINNIDDDSYIIKYNIDDNINDIAILGDKMMLKRALENLINNSIIHNTDGCIIEINASLDCNGLIIIVKDNGVGMKEKVNNMFYKENDYIDTDKDLLSSKHGLGLKIARKIIENHNGIMVIESTEDNGFKNIISIPL